MSAVRLSQEIPAPGDRGRGSIRREVLRPLRQAPRRLGPLTGRVETAPGEQGQVDGGHCGTTLHHGQRCPRYGFVLVLGSSRAVFVPFTTTQRLETCLCCHGHAFEAFGGSPRALLYDHAKTVVLAHPDLRAEAPSSAPPWHPQGLDVAGYDGVTPRLGRPSRARPKGQVERMRRDVRESCCAGGHGVDLDDLHRQVALWCATVANARGHATTGEVPAIRLARELW